MLIQKKLVIGYWSFCSQCIVGHFTNLSVHGITIFRLRDFMFILICLVSFGPFDSIWLCCCLSIRWGSVCSIHGESSYVIVKPSIGFMWEEGRKEKWGSCTKMWILEKMFCGWSDIFAVWMVFVSSMMGLL